MKLFRVHRSHNGIVMILGESGTFFPPEIAVAMTDAATRSSSPARWLIDVCGDAATDTPTLRDAGLVATLVSPLVVDAMKPLEETLANDWSNMYRNRTDTGEAIYRDPSFALSPADHTLRRETFYLPFHRKIDSEISRTQADHGRSLAVTIRCDPGPHQQITFRGGRTVCDEPTMQARLVKQASEFGITLVFQEQDSDSIANLPTPLNLKMPDVAWCDVAISASCFTQHDAWSSSRAHATRQTLDAIFGEFVAS